MTQRITVGVLGLQGDYQKHIESMRQLGCSTSMVRLPAEIAAVDALIIPGGESTTILKLLRRFGSDDSIKDMHKRGQPIYGTCAGLISLCREIVSETQAQEGQNPLGLINVAVARNGFGSQLDSFESDIKLGGQSERPFKAVFIRAPIITQVGSEVEVIADHAGSPVLVRQGSVLASTFHPELSDDLRIHEIFLELAHSNG